MYIAVKNQHFLYLLTLNQRCCRYREIVKDAKARAKLTVSVMSTACQVASQAVTKSQQCGEECTVGGDPAPVDQALTPW